MVKVEADYASHVEALRSDLTHQGALAAAYILHGQLKQNGEPGLGASHACVLTVALHEPCGAVPLVHQHVVVKLQHVCWEEIGALAGVVALAIAEGLAENILGLQHANNRLCRADTLAEEQTR